MILGLAIFVVSLTVTATAYYAKYHVYKSCQYVERMGSIKEDTYVLIRCTHQDFANMKGEFNK